MHRSGTSLFVGILQRLGVSLPGDTIAGDQHNPEGYFEWDAVVAIKERLLIDLERWWPAAEGTQAHRSIGCLIINFFVIVEMRSEKV